MYALIKNQQVITHPYTIAQLKRDNPNTSFPDKISTELLASLGVYEVAQTDQPTYAFATHRVKEGTPALSAGVWTQTWHVVALTADEFTQQQLVLQNDIVAQTQERLDNFARTRGYDGILSACTYATSTVPKFQQEGQYCVTARDATWASLYQILAEVEAGTRPMPAGFEAIEPLLPAVSWP